MRIEDLEAELGKPKPARTRPATIPEVEEDDGLDALLGDADAGEDPDLTTLRTFAAPPDARTMANLSDYELRALARIATKGRFLGTPYREKYVENRLLMSRSRAGWGSNQMRDVAIRGRDGGAPTGKGGMLKRFFLGDGGAGGGQE